MYFRVILGVFGGKGLGVFWGPEMFGFLFVPNGIVSRCGYHGIVCEYLALSQLFTAADTMYLYFVL